MKGPYGKDFKRNYYKAKFGLTDDPEHMKVHHRIRAV